MVKLCEALRSALFRVSCHHAVLCYMMLGPLMGRQDVAEHFYELFTHPVRNLLGLPSWHIAHDGAVA